MAENMRLRYAFKCNKTAAPLDIKTYVEPCHEMKVCKTALFHTFVQSGAPNENVATLSSAATPRTKVLRRVVFHTFMFMTILHVKPVRLTGDVIQWLMCIHVFWDTCHAAAPIKVRYGDHHQRYGPRLPCKQCVFYDGSLFPTLNFQVLCSPP